MNTLALIQKAAPGITWGIICVVAVAIIGFSILVFWTFIRQYVRFAQRSQLAKFEKNKQAETQVQT